MIRIDKKEFEQTTSVCIKKVQAGETIIITDADAPIAEVHPVSEGGRGEIRPVFHARTPRERRLGFLKDKITIHPSFYDPMDEEELKLWEEGDPRSPI